MSDVGGVMWSELFEPVPYNHISTEISVVVVAKHNNCIAESLLPLGRGLTWYEISHPLLISLTTASFYHVSNPEHSNPSTVTHNAMADKISLVVAVVAVYRIDCSVMRFVGSRGLQRSGLYQGITA